jgi:hypothetical protein
MKIRVALLLAAAVLACGQDLNSITQSAGGNITAADTNCTGVSCVWITMPVNTLSASVALSGTFSATVQFEASVGGSVWTAIASTAAATSSSSTGTFSFSLAGQRFLRVRCSAFTSGSVRVDISSSAGSGGSSNGWSDDGSTITAAAGRNVAAGATCPPGVSSTVCLNALSLPMGTLPLPQVITSAGPTGVVAGAPSIANDASSKNFWGYENLSQGVWSFGVATFRTQNAHHFVVGSLITVTSAVPAGYNGTFRLSAIPDSTHISYLLPSNPGAYVSGGNVVLQVEVQAAPWSPNVPAAIFAANPLSVSLGLDPHLPVVAVVGGDGNFVNNGIGFLADGHTRETWFGSHQWEFANGHQEYHVSGMMYGWTANDTDDPSNSANIDIVLARCGSHSLCASRSTTYNSPDSSGTFQSGVTATDPGCTTTADVGKLWFNTTTTTTVFRVCLNVAGTVGWVTK